MPVPSSTAWKKNNSVPLLVRVSTTTRNQVSCWSLALSIVSMPELLGGHHHLHSCHSKAVGAITISTRVLPKLLEPSPSFSNRVLLSQYRCDNRVFVGGCCSTLALAHTCHTHALGNCEITKRFVLPQRRVLQELCQDCNEI